MRKLVLMFFVAALVAIGATTALAKTVVIQVTNKGFVPPNISVETGDAVSWTNSDTALHQVRVDRTNCNLTLQPAQTSACTFNTAGSFPYSDPSQKAAGFKGAITVTQAPTRSVAIAASRPLVIFGGAVRISGTISSGKAGETVTILEQPAGEPLRRIDVQTDAEGFELRVQPRIATIYQAQYKNALSRKIEVAVRPRVQLRQVGVNRFSAIVLAANSFEGRYVLFTRFSHSRYVTVRRVYLEQSPRTDTIAVATFRSRIKRGTKLRLFLPESQAAPDYLAGQSNFIVK
jgi:plastocyanin